MGDGKRTVVSVVTPSFNQAEFLVRNIESVRSQWSDKSDFDLEHIIIDGGSTDTSVEILKSYPHLRWISEKDAGQSDALNKGYRMVRGDLVGTLNTDDTYEPGAISRIVDFFARNPDVDVVYGLCHLIDENDRVIKTWDPPEFRLKWLIRLGVSCIPHLTSFYRRSALEGVGLLDVNLHYAMDYDFFIRIGLKGFRVQKVPYLLANFRLHPSSKSVHDTNAMWRESKSVRARYSQEPWPQWALGFCSYKAQRLITKAGKVLGIGGPKS